MLTESGVPLILRVVGTPSDDPWNTYAWEWFAIIAGLSLATKYVIKWKGSHVLNPSNIGVVGAFLILGVSTTPSPKPNRSRTSRHTSTSRARPQHGGPQSLTRPSLTFDDWGVITA